MTKKSELEPAESQPKPAAKPMFSESRPFESRPAEPKPAEPKPAEPRPAEPRPAEPRPAEPRPAEPKPAEPKPAEPKFADKLPPKRLHKRPYVENVSGIDLTFSYGGDQYVLPPGRTYFDEAFPEKSRAFAIVLCQHAHQKYHHVLDGDQREPRAKVVVGYEMAEAKAKD